MNKNVQERLRALSNEELVTLCRKNDRAALYELIVRFAPSIRKRAESFAGGAHDDLAQEGFLALLISVRSYSEERGASFSTYANLCVRNRMINVFKSSGTDHDELPDDPDIPDETAADPENTVVEQAALDELYGKISAALSKHEFSVFRLYIAGKSYQDIAEALGVSEKSVDNAVQRMKRKLRDVLR